jgi:hypothetical protein
MRKGGITPQVRILHPALPLLVRVSCCLECKFHQIRTTDARFKKAGGSMWILIISPDFSDPKSLNINGNDLMSIATIYRVAGRNQSRRSQLANSIVTRPRNLPFYR